MARNLLVALCLVACAPKLPARTASIPDVTPAAVPAPAMPPPVSGPVTSVAPVVLPEPSVEPEIAYRSGMMPLQSTGIPEFAAAFPEFDGRGVLIAILDSGLDPSIAGLRITTTGLPKLLDLRDFSGEGRVALTSLERRADTIMVGGRRLTGAARVAGIADAGLLWGGVLRELSLGEPPAADLDGNGTVGDLLPVVVVRSGSGWVMFADLNGNGSLADDRPVRDYAIARESFGWSSTNQPPPVTIAANLGDSAGVPILDLLFDTSGHGSHVAGIAAGHDIYGVKGFDGVAPGARVIGLKVANNAHGGVTVTRSMVRALAYAIRFARERSLRLVVNLSFGVGNEVEGSARVEATIDSMLGANPGVVMTVAAGNDGPGLSSVGFPGGAARVWAVGATEPGGFDGFDVRAAQSDPVADYSSRGGELAAPDLTVPGRAYSTVPMYATGNEQESGTSMASPYAAGLAARLISAANAGQLEPSAATIRQALLNSAKLPPGGSIVDAGAGTPDLSAAWEWLARAGDVPVVDVGVGGIAARAGVFLTAIIGERIDPALSTRVVVRQHGGPPLLFLRVRSTSPWVGVPATVTLVNGRGDFAITVHPGGFAPGVQTASVELTGPVTAEGILARIPVTYRLALSRSSRVATQAVKVQAGGISRVFVPADSGRGMQVEVATETGDPQVSASLHEPGGMPFRDGGLLPAGAGDGAALFDIPASDVEEGLYEIDVASGPVSASAATVTVRRAPVRLEARRRADTLTVVARSVINSPVSIRLRAGLIGAEQEFKVGQMGDAPVRLAIAVPTWATRVQVDSRMPRDQWGRFTDFGVSFHDRTGRQFAAAPINYAFGRAAPELPPRLQGDSLIILLSPALADSWLTNWQLDVNVRFYSERVVSLDQGGRTAQTIAAGKVLEERFVTGLLPMDLPKGFRPVIVVLAQEGDDHIWMREIALQGGTVR